LNLARPIMVLRGRLFLFLFFRFLKFVNELRREIPFICDVRAVIKNW
jgi:hypothetical protein